MSDSAKFFQDCGIKINSSYIGSFRFLIRQPKFRLGIIVITDIFSQKKFPPGKFLAKISKNFVWEGRMEASKHGIDILEGVSDLTRNTFFKQKWTNPGHFFCLFSSFQNVTIQI